MAVCVLKGDVGLRNVIVVTGDSLKTVWTDSQSVSQSVSPVQSSPVQSVSQSVSQSVHENVKQLIVPSRHFPVSNILLFHKATGSSQCTQYERILYLFISVYIE